MNQRIDVMVDIETWGTGPDAVIRAVALAAAGGPGRLSPAPGVAEAPPSGLKPLLPSLS